MLTTASLAVSKQMLHSNTESSFFSSSSSLASSRLILDLPVLEDDVPDSGLVESAVADDVDAVG